MCVNFYTQKVFHGILTPMLEILCMLSLRVQCDPGSLAASTMLSEVRLRVLFSASSQRALGVLGHQKRFLREHRAGLEKWTCAVYGFKLSTETCGPSGTVGAALGNRETQDGQEPLGGGPSLREVRVNVKCKGTKRRVDKLLAHVDQTWSPRHTGFKNVKRRSSVRAGAEKTAKRGKPAFAKVDQVVAVANSAANTTEEIVETGPADGQKDGMPGEQGAPGQGWRGPEARTPFPLSSERQQLQEDLSLETEDRLEVTSVTLTPSGSSAPAGAKAVVDPGTSESAVLPCKILNAHDNTFRWQSCVLLRISQSVFH